jgi:outer membrane lipoprotein carrier protein
MIKSAVALFSVLLLSPLALAQDAAELLAERLAAHQRFSAEFQQYTLGDGSAREELSQGRMWIENPNRVRWETEQPFPQLIVGDGENLWIYDPDLEQATRRSMSQEFAVTPASVLGASRDELEARFWVTKIDAAGSDNLFELRPKASDNAEFERLRMLFGTRSLSEILIEDGLGQRSLIMLKNVSFPTQIDPARFTFTPPPGTDLIEAQPR